MYEKKFKYFHSSSIFPALWNIINFLKFKKKKKEEKHWRIEK